MVIYQKSHCVDLFLLYDIKVFNKHCDLKTFFVGDLKILRYIALKY